jgi:hypothetical protein
MLHETSRCALFERDIQIKPTQAEACATKKLLAIIVAKSGAVLREAR